MAIGIQNYPNITSADSDFPNGSIKDDTGANDGTPVNKEVYNDIHQVFAKFLRLANITPSGNFESEYTEFQYINAIKKLFGRSGDVEYVDNAGSFVREPDFNKVLVFTPYVTLASNVILDITDEYQDKLTLTVSNQSLFNVNVTSNNSYPINFLHTAIVVTPGQVRTFLFDREVGPMWVEV